MFSKTKCAALTGVALFAMHAAAFAQGAADDVIEQIIVTGTKVDRTGFDTPSSVATVGEDDLRFFAAGSGSQADVLQNLPGLNAEGGGGEVATNFRARGLPSGGQFEFTPLNYDGVPVFSTFGLNSSAFDFFARNDLGVERLEYNKGGVANLFGVGGQVGVINYISKTGGEETHGSFQLEWAEEDRYRADYAMQGAVSDNTFYAVSGFYRIDEGPLDTGLDTEGFSMRGNILHEFEDGSGSFRVHGSYINDRVAFYLPTVLDEGDRSRVDGNDGRKVYTLNSSAVAGLTAKTPEGITSFDADNGFRTVGGSIYAILEKDMGDGWGIDARVKYATYDSGSNFFQNGAGPDELNARPVTQASFLAAHDVGFMRGDTFVPATIANTSFTYAETGAALAADDLLFQNQFNDRERDASDATIEINLTKEMEIGAMTHNFTLGVFIARAQADNIQRGVLYLGDFTNNPELVAVTITDDNNTAMNTADDTAYQVTTAGGILQAPAAYANQDREAFRRAIYFADQIQSGRWQFDAGLRIEAQTARNKGEASALVPAELVDNPAVTAPDNDGNTGNALVAQQLFGTGVFSEGDATATAWALAGAVSYAYSDNINLYANGSRGFFFPKVEGTVIQLGDIRHYEDERILQFAAGVKYRNDVFDGYIEGFFTGLRDRTRVSYRTASATDPTLVKTDSDTFGVEMDGRFRVNDYVRLLANFVYQNHEVSSENASVDGKEFNRLPDVIANIGVLAQYKGFDGSLFWNYNGATYADEANTVELDSFSIVRLDAGYNFDVGNDNNLRLSLNVWNLLDSDGLQEGNPRTPLEGQAGTSVGYFIGRPILPRRITLRLTYDF